MRLAVSGNGYASATNTFLDANHLAADAAHALMSALSHTGAMAGHTATTFADSYDQAAQQGVSALVDLVDALANLGRMTEATLHNHARAEARAVIGGSNALPEAARPPSYTHVTMRPPPTSAGTHGADLPGWAAWILDHIEGFVWPDSDTDRLRSAAHAWRTTSAQLESIKARCLEAAFSLSIEVAPDVELATDATRSFATHIDSLAQTLHGLARSCDDLADEVHRHRDHVLDIVHDTLRDAVVVEGIGIVLGAVTGGITAAAASSVNGARIAAIAPRIVRIIEALRIGIGASETGARIATESVIETRASIRAFIDARVIASSSERGCAGSPLWFAHVLDDGGRVIHRAPGWLYANEERGHVIARHVAKTDDWLLARLARDGIDHASSFSNVTTAERAIQAALDHHSEEVATWLSTNRRNLELDHAMNEVVGRTCSADGRCLDMRSLRVVLRADDSAPGGYYIRTAFPK